MWGKINRVRLCLTNLGFRLAEKFYVVGIFVLICCDTTSVFSAVWWDNFPRVAAVTSLSSAQTYSATAAINAVANDPGWGLWFTYESDSGVAASNVCASYQAAGIISLSYNESFGQMVAPIAELKWSPSLQRWNYSHDFWNWQNYSNGPIVWAGAWSWFDSFTNDSPTNASEASYFARPYTRMHPIYGGGAMLYPDGIVATGFMNNDTNATDPRNSRVYDAGCSKDIYGRIGDLGYQYNASASAANQQHTGMLWIPADGKYSGAVNLGRDTACPSWTNYTAAETLSAAQLTGSQGSWADNVGPWDSFMSGGPVSCAFGEWSVALFQSYLTNHFTAGQLSNWGVLATNAPLAAITNFNVRNYLLTTASNQFGLATTNLGDAAWKNSGWFSNSVWSAFKIFRRQNGSAALTNYDQNVHIAAAQGGQTNFALLANDINPSSFGWARETFDLTSTELSVGWSVTAGSRGFGLPPFGRLAPLYKAMREHGRSRFVTVWLYTNGYPSALTSQGPVNALFYEMLATHTLPKITVGSGQFAGTSAIQTNFLAFVAQQAAPAFANRMPVEEVGLYLSTSSILATALPGDAENFSAQNHQYAIWGWGTALSELHYQYRIVPEWKLTTNLLQTLKVLIIPNANVFDPADVPTLQNWVATGGCLIVTGNSGVQLGEAGNFNLTNNLVLAPLTGVSVTNVSLWPSAKTNFLGAGAVWFMSNNVGLTYYNTNATGRGVQRSIFASALSNAFAFLNVPPVLASSNAPVTVGLTLYQDAAALKTFVDLNNFNVDTNTFVTTNTPMVNVNVARPAWLTNGMSATATIVSPDGPLTVTNLTVDASRVYFQLPSVTNYLSVILQPATNHPPVAVSFELAVVTGTSVGFNIINGKYAPSDVDGDTLTVTAVGTPGISGNTFTTDGTNVIYTAVSSSTRTDVVSYTVGDGNGGADTKYVTNNVTANSNGSYNLIYECANQGNGMAIISYAGIPGYNYALETTAQLPATNWTPVATNPADSNGKLSFTFSASVGQGYFRVRAAGSSTP